MKRDLGALGESTLTRWAADRGISAQKVTQDRHGWDYLLEFPLALGNDNESAILPLDRAPVPISCLVQVKATSTKALNSPVKLVNWHRLIKNPLPVFFLILDFGSSDSPSSAYLVPLDETAISRALRRIRKLDSQSKNISRHKLNVLCFEEQRLETPNGEAFERAIRSHITPNLEEYIKKKALWRETVGYESGKRVFRFEVPEAGLGGVDFLETMVDLSLGLRGPLPVGRAELRDVRFGIPAKEPDKEFPTGATLEIIPEPVEIVDVTLRFGTSVAQIKMDMFLPRGLGDVLKVGLCKMRLSSKFFDFSDCRQRINISSHLPQYDAREKLSDFYDLARVVLLLNEAAISTTKGAKLTVRTSKGKLGGALDSCTGINSGLIDFATIVRDAWTVARHLEIEERVYITMEELLLQRERLSTLRKTLAGEKLGTIYSSFIEPVPEHEGERACALHPVGVILGDYIGTVMVSLWGVFNPTGRIDGRRHEYELMTAEVKVERAFATTRDEDHSAIIRAAKNAFVDTYKDMLCIVPPDF